MSPNSRILMLSLWTCMVVSSRSPTLKFWYFVALVQTGCDPLMQWHGVLTMCWCGMLGPHVKSMSTHSQHAMLGPMLALGTSVETQVSKWGPRMIPLWNFRGCSWILLFKKRLDHIVPTHSGRLRKTLNFNSVVLFVIWFFLIIGSYYD